MEKLSHRRKLIDYFKKNLDKGYSSESLKVALEKQGYTKTDVAAALDLAKEEIEKERPELKKEKPKITYQLYDSDNKPIYLERKPFWKKILGL